MFLVFRLFVCFIFITGFFPACYATTYTWAKNTVGAGTYAWSTAANWSPASVPATGDDVIFNAPTAAQTITFPTGTLTLNSISVVGAVGKLYTLDLTGCDLVVSGTTVRFTYVSVSSASSISITASDNVLMSSSAFGNFPITIVANSTTKAGGSTANNPATNTYTNQALQLQSCLLNGAFTAEAKKFLFTSNTFNGTFTLTKKDYSVLTGGSVSTGNSLNTFNATTVITQEDNSASGGLQWADRDTYNGVTTFHSNSTTANNTIVINPFAGTTNFTNHAYFYNTGAGINISNGPSCTVNFSKGSGVSADSVEVFVYNSGTGNIVIGNSGGVTFDNCKILLGNTSSGQIRFSSSGATTAPPVIINSNCSFNAFPDSTSAGSGKPYFSSGRLYLDNVDLKSSSSISSLILNPSALIEFRQRSIYSRTMVSRAGYPSFGGVFNAPVTFINTATGATVSFNGLTFNSHVTIINQAMGPTPWNFFGNSTITNLTDRTVNFNTTSSSRSVVVIENQGASSLMIAYHKSYVSFNNVDIVFRRMPGSLTSTPGNIHTTYYGKIIVDADSRLFIDQTADAGASSNLGIYLGATAVDLQALEFYGAIHTCGTTTSPNSCGETTSGMPATNGLKNSFLAFATVNVKNNLEFTTPSDADTTTAVLFYYFPVFEKNLTIKCQNFGGNGGSFNKNNGVSVSGGPNNGTTVLDCYGKGSGARVFTGTFTFDGNTTLINESLNGNTFLLGNATGDKFYFNSDLLIKNITIGAAPVPVTRLIRNGANAYLRGDLRYEGEFGAVPFGYGGTGTCYFDGAGFLGKSNSETQTISCNSTNSTLAMTKLEVNKASGKLVLANDVKVIKYSTAAGLLTLRKGNILANPTGASTPVGMLILSDDATVAGGGVHSYVEGPVNKQGDDAFKFHIGKGSRYFPLSITAPSNATGSFTAEFFSQNIPVASTLSGTLKDLVKCQYWKMDKTGTATAKVTLSWKNASGQNCTTVDPDVVTVARFNGTSWDNEGAANLVSSPGDSGIVQTTNAITNFTYFTLGSTLANTITPNDVYAVLKKSMDGSYYTVSNGNLYFRFEEEYAVSGSGWMYKVLDESNAVVATPSATVNYGDNRYAWTVSGLITGKYYVLEAVNSKNEKWVLRFKA